MYVVDVFQWDIYAEIRVRRKRRLQDSRVVVLRAVRLPGRDHVLFDLHRGCTMCVTEHLLESRT